jgi:hypothetical protein
MSVDEDVHQHVLDGYSLDMAKLRAELETTLQQERKSYADGDESDVNIQGWIEALQYALRQIENFKGESA